MPEFDLIRQLQERICNADAPRRPQCVLGIGDDAALFEMPADRQLVACTDSLVEGVHFPPSTPAAAVGHKALAVNLSDLAAMGAEPAWYLLSLTLPRVDPEWLDAFAAGMARLAADSGAYLSGGDMSSGPLNVCVTALGLVEPGKALTRSGARPGDRVVISGRPGAAAHALAAIRAGGEPDERDRAALDFPVPRLSLGRALIGTATSCIDLSDGLLADLGHVLEHSGVGAELDLRSLPCPLSMAGMAEHDRWPLQLGGGDDYELCFTLPAQSEARLPGLAEAAGVELTVIGSITAQPGLRIRDPAGGLYLPRQSGYEHFRDDGAALP
ncbi:MAG TPA: thiamine-phosphate kinase [Xanthomonadales bacterium]|nr:thiamine-phosphate kinase [Xanthomonadales bacterium]